NPDVSSIPLPRLRNTMSSLFRALIISLATNANRDIEVARQVNLGLRLLESAKQASTSDEVKALIRQMAALVRHIENDTAPYRSLTIHRYHPREMYGGLFRWLSFGRDHMLALIQRGFADTLVHDCSANNCVLPNEVSSPSA